MKIAMLVDRYKPYISGVTNYISLNKAFLEKAGHKVYVFTFGDLDYKDDESNIIRSPGIPLIDTGYYVSLRYSRRARHLLYEMDIAHIHHPFLSGSLALRYCRPRGIPTIFTNHTRYDLYAQAYFPILPEAVGETVMRAFLPAFCRACNQIIAPSPGMADVLKSFGVDVPVAVIPNGVDLKPFQENVAPIDRRDFGIADDDLILIYVGRLGPEKNLGFLIQSFRGTAAAYEHVHLILVGDGPERESLQATVENMQLKGRVHFTGFMPYEKLPGYLAMSDAFVTASVTEVHPLSVIEAMAAGLPVLGIESPGVGDTVEDGVTGYISQEDLAMFTAKMIRMVTDHESRKVMSIKARDASQKYRIERTTQIMNEQYKNLVSGNLHKKRQIRTKLTRFFDHWL